MTRRQRYDVVFCEQPFRDADMNNCMHIWELLGKLLCSEFGRVSFSAPWLNLYRAP